MDPIVEKVNRTNLDRKKLSNQPSISTCKLCIYVLLIPLKHIRHFSQGKKPDVDPTKSARNIVGTTSSVEGVLADFPTPILTKIEREPTIEDLIKLHQLISGNSLSVVSKLRGGWHRHLALTMTAEDNMT